MTVHIRFESSLRKSCINTREKALDLHRRKQERFNALNLYYKHCPESSWKQNWNATTHFATATSVCNISFIERIPSNTGMAKKNLNLAEEWGWAVGNDSSLRPYDFKIYTACTTEGLNIICERVGRALNTTLLLQKTWTKMYCCQEVDKGYQLFQ